MNDSFDNDALDAATRVGQGSSGGYGYRQMAKLAPGAVFGNYRVVSCLGEGGMGEVYEVEHYVLQQRHALKLLHADLAGGAAGRERFAREARVMASLHHAGIVRVDDFGETDGRVWLRMELADGIEVAPGQRVRTLSEMLAASGGRLNPRVAASALEQILDALGMAHGAGLVHRDLKPANILLDRNGGMKIADFGLVQVAGDEWLRSRVSQTVARSMTLGSAETRVGSRGSGSLQAGERALMGTWDYMSPEQKAGGLVDARSDLYAIGLIAFRLLTGEAVLAMEMPSEIVDGLDPAWDGWVRKAVASRPDKRFSSASEMSASLPRGGAVQAVGMSGTIADRPAPATVSGPPPAVVPDRASSPSIPPPVPVVKTPPAVVPPAPVVAPTPPPVPESSRPVIGPTFGPPAAAGSGPPSSSPDRPAPPVPPPVPSAADAPSSAVSPPVTPEPRSTGRPEIGTQPLGAETSEPASMSGTRPHPVPPPVPPRLPMPEGGVPEIVEGFERVAMRPWAASIWSLLLPGLGPALRGRPLVGFLIALVPGAGSLLVGQLGVFELLLINLIASGAAIGFVLAGGRGGPFQRLGREAALGRAGVMRGLYIAGFVMLILITLLCFAGGCGFVIEILSRGYLPEDLLMGAISCVLAGVLGTWMTIRFWRFVRFLGRLGGTS